MNKSKNNNISLTSLRRLPDYLRFLKDEKQKGVSFMSSSVIAEKMQLSPMVVKKDLAIAKIIEGKPKLGYHLDSLIADIETFLGYNNKKDAVVVGCGKLGKALLSYEGFTNYGLNIVVGFDVDQSIEIVSGKKILPMTKFTDLVKRLNIHIGILTVPKEVAQEIAEMMVASGIKAIWNWAPIKLDLPATIVIKQEDLSASLAELSGRLDEIL